MTKRLIDIGVSVLVLVVGAPLFLIIALVVLVDSGSPVIFAQERVGRNFRPFRILKFRTMRVGDGAGAKITVAGDARITRVGGLLRTLKLDELPQAVNVLRGDMSLVGPRPEVARYVEMFRDDYKEILTLRPGLTDLASIRYRHESAILAAASDPERAYVEQILPDKIALAREYVATSSLALDAKIIWETAVIVLDWRTAD